ncbi:Ig-like domain-containing protein, partial [Holdemania filiformis]
VEPQAIKLNTDKLSLMSDKTARLSVSFDPSRTDNRLKGLVWESDNEEIATVSSTGIVTAKKAGVTTIRVRSAVLPDLEDEVIVSVTAPLTYYRFLETSNTTVNLNMIVGAMDDIEILARTKDGSQPNISWKNSDESVVALSAEGSHGTVKALKPGTSTLTIQCADKTLIRKVTVYPVNSLSSLKMEIDNYTSAGLEIGEERPIRVVGSIGQEEVNDRATLTSSNPKVAVIDEAGKLKAIGLGTTTITATVKD